MLWRLALGVFAALMKAWVICMCRISIETKSLVSTDRELDFLSVKVSVLLKMAIGISTQRGLFPADFGETGGQSDDFFEHDSLGNMTFELEPDEQPGWNSTDEFVPERLTADYVEMGLLGVLVLVGGPLNLVSLSRSLGVTIPGILSCLFLHRRRHSAVAIDPNRQFNLKIHLTVANLLVLWGYALSDLCWLATYNWLGGDFMCRVVRFLHAFCFYATSNLISTIAIRRLKVAMRLDRPTIKRRRSTVANLKIRGHMRGGGIGWKMRSLANCAWILAFLCSLPQLFVWQTYEAGGWEQCVTIWTIQRYEAPKESLDHMKYQEKIYNVLHLVFVFWLPVLIILACYTLIVTRFSRKIRKQTKQMAAEVTAQVENRAASVRASLVVGGPVDAGSPLLLPIAVLRAMQYQSTGSTRMSLPHVVSPPLPVPSSLVILRKSNRDKLFCLPCCAHSRYRHSRRVEVLPTDEDYDDQTGMTPSILNATLIGGKPHARKSFALATLSRAKKRTMKTTMWILLAYLLCWSPYNVLILWRYVSPSENLYDFELMYNLIVLNAVVNPLLYGI